MPAKKKAAKTKTPKNPKKELKKVVNHANNIKGVLKVVSHTIMKDDPRRIKYQRKLQKKND